MRGYCKRCLSSTFELTDHGCTFCEDKEVSKTPISEDSRHKLVNVHPIPRVPKSNVTRLSQRQGQVVPR